MIFSIRVLSIVLVFINFATASEKALGKFSFSLTNDVLFKTDRYYTNGALIYFRFPDSKFEFSIGQDIYTPNATKVTNPPLNDLPYSAWLFTSVDYNYNLPIIALLKGGVSFGTVGPRAKGEQVQNHFYEKIGSDKELGWDTQIFNEYGWIGKLAAYFHMPLGFLKSDYFRFTPYIKSLFGNIKRINSVGADFYLGFNVPKLSALNIIDSGLRLYLFGGYEYRNVGFNIHLEGNTENGVRSRHVEIVRSVDAFSGGFVMGYKEFDLKFSAYTISEEFEMQLARGATLVAKDNYGKIELSFYY